ncbi:hypothetical protein BV898_19347 [Hypsibius exemplaris]|uniref:Nuclear receptor domain-containing protein n=1 Tax=Hypsibius exemplaris TaxID=2072580 RepID=A0A9X6NIS6_HYPEX|nr:hypothetical protein BV898_19347 [Hypsibius exemplaris]
MRQTTGTHFSVSTCEGCKAFFRRTIENGRLYVCKFNNNCVIARVNACCRACRYRKCLDVGMKITWTRTRRRQLQQSANQRYSNESGSSPPRRFETNQVIPCNIFGEDSSDLIRHESRMNRDVRGRLFILKVLELTTDVVFGGLNTHSSEWHGTASSSSWVAESTLEVCHDLHMVFPERNEVFAAMLPGISALDCAEKRSLTTDWKWTIFWLMRNVDRTLSFGLEFTEDSSETFTRVIGFVYNFCKELNNIGLTKTEKCLLLAIAMLESNSPSQGISNLQSLHHHYLTVLMEALKQRCSDQRHLFSVIQNVVRFFSSLKDVDLIHRQYSRDLAQLWVIF